MTTRATGRVSHPGNDGDLAKVNEELMGATWETEWAKEIALEALLIELTRTLDADRPRS
jgi:hypothetical protein